MYFLFFVLENFWFEILTWIVQLLSHILTIYSFFIASTESVPNRTKLTKTKGHINTASTQSDISSPSILSEISRLEALCEARTKELNLTKLKLKTNLQGFDAMSVLVQYLSHQLDAFSTPKLKEQLKVIERQLTATNRRIGEEQYWLLLFWQRNKLQQKVTAKGTYLMSTFERYDIFALSKKDN